MAEAQAFEPKRWASQLRKGSLELCLLALLSQQARYGFDLSQHLQERAQWQVSEGTLYPLLNRLQNEGWIEAFWQESASGPPRKYYRCTPAGLAVLAAMRREWERHAQGVARLLEEGPAEGVEATKPLEVQAHDRPRA